MTSTPVQETRTAPTDPDWWRQAVVYQVYPRSFADSNGDGIGDLQGIISRVPYLVSLGIDAVWLSPFYPSALADGGYDVDDYRDVDPRLGTLADFDELVGALHDAGIKLIVDIVPNHSSDRHEWFRQAVAAPKGSPERDRYIFREGVGDEPPSDWDSVFGGSAWAQIHDGQWYLHLFAAEQPDLNWDNQEVREDFLTTLRFWSDRGVDGFRVDVAHALVKDLTEPLPSKTTLPRQSESNGVHPLWDRDEVHEIYTEWRKVLNEYDPPRSAVAEAFVPAARRARYASAAGLGQAFNFDLLQADWDHDKFRQVITENLALAEQNGSSSTWVFSNHDVVRHATRYGLPKNPHGTWQDGKAWLLSNGTEPTVDVEQGLRRARAAVLLMLALPGSAYLYQGEELGLQEVGELPAANLQDPAYFRSKGAEKGRDGCRVPLPWTIGGLSFGFGSGGSHLLQPKWFGAYSVEAQEGDPESTLSLYRKALAVRRGLQTGEGLEWVDADDLVLHFKRPGGWQSVTNFGAAPIELPDGAVVLASGPLEGDKLPTDTTAWLI
ncbi:alpha amylase catalytic region [Kribbella flavida DSM 17836]|uniref:Alpha amylase catalytic region n=1 Tax=Kribbella flavida (strain DSM 17836 / JCM 10339 / NBRC 14399) TaxID=479435 RepID=D2PXL8_KRIFD|nr:glycoside hydrolase family 13 protein [Kribbella flavida]ADB31660.1 alpha amylase catalytic region [Kribbella flavida DSM 17836]